MPNANVYLTWNGQTRFLQAVDETVISRYSRVARNALQSQTVRPKRVDISDVSPGPLKFVIEKAVKHGNNVRIIVHDGSIPRAVMILQAINALDMEPAQPHVEQHIVGHISHERIKPDEMVAIHTAFGHEGVNNRIWRVMLHQIAWDSIHEKFTVDQKAALVEATKKLPDLDAALLQRAQYLARKKGNHEAAMAAKDRRLEAQAARERDRQARDDQRKFIAESNRRVREYKEHRWWEETHGMRPASEETIRYLREQKAYDFPVYPGKDWVHPAAETEEVVEEDPQA